MNGWEQLYSEKETAELEEIVYISSEDYNDEVIKFIKELLKNRVDRRIGKTHKLCPHCKNYIDISLDTCDCRKGGVSGVENPQNTMKKRIMKTCPKCDKINPNKSLECDCGYIFENVPVENKTAQKNDESKIVQLNGLGFIAAGLIIISIIWNLIIGLSSGAMIGMVVGTIIGSAIGMGIVYLLFTRLFKRKSNLESTIWIASSASLIFMLVVTYITNGFNIFYLIFLSLYVIFDFRSVRNTNRLLADRQFTFKKTNK